MDRLTQRTPHGVVRTDGVTGGAILRLAAYEDTGLTPDEIEVLKADRDRWQKRAAAVEQDLIECITELGDTCRFCGNGKCQLRNGIEGCRPVWRGPCAESGGIV